MYQFILKSDKEFALKSIYYQAGYLPQFEDKDKAIQTKQKYPIYSVSGVQTAFLSTIMEKNVLTIRQMFIQIFC